MLFLLEMAITKDHYTLSAIFYIPGIWGQESRRRRKNEKTKLFGLSQWYLPLFAYTHAKFERVEALLKGQACCLKTAT